ncbi:MAG: cytochrome b N-terminal domain-containing protein [Chloroflexi bacterium]|nr:cytochrome b N-terminal domain-containing protein [Chloroflexota bacterium]
METMERLTEIVTRSRFWTSFFRHGWPDNEVSRALVVTSNVFMHLHPVRVRRHGLRFSYTLGLGGLGFLLFLILSVTGGLLMFYYVPATSQAYDNMQDLQFAVSYGRLWRNLHRWAAHLMVVSVSLHMCRVFYTAAYKPPREFNWVLGVSLFVLTLAFSFTGYLLPWDQLAFWAITVGTNIGRAMPLIGEQLRFLLLGGNVVGQNALLRFYALHVFVLPSIALFVMIVHFWRVRKDGGISGPPAATAPSPVPPTVPGDGKMSASVASAEASFGPNPHKTYQLLALPDGMTLLLDKQPEDTEMTFPHLLVRELTYALAATALLIGVAFAIDAPLEELANPTKTPNPAKAPWYFLGLQEMVSWGNPFWGGVLAPGLMLVALLLLPYFDRTPEGVGVWFSRHRKWPVIVFTAWVVAMAGLIVIGYFFRGPGWQWYWPWMGTPVH